MRIGCGKLKDRIRYFTLEYSQWLAVDMTKKVKALKYSLYQADACGGFPKDRFS